MTVTAEKLEEHTKKITAHVTGKFKELDDYLDPKLSWAASSQYTPLIVAAFGIACFVLGHLVGKLF